jgi:hypothetical protein
VPDSNLTDRLRQVTHREVPRIAVVIAGPEGYPIDAIARLALTRT